MDRRHVVFKFKGNRNYLHGTDFFNAMTAGYPATALQNIRFSVHGFVSEPDCQIYVTDYEEEINAVADIRARCQFDVDNQTKWLVLTPGIAKKSPKHRYEFDEEQILSCCSKNDNTISLCTQSPFSFIENIVAMSKHLHQYLFPEVQGQWLFTRIELTRGSDRRDSIGLTLKHNMKYRLTKSDIIVDGQKIGDLFFSLLK